ncbi:MAG: CmcI family methyltransferase [Verrucomicrobiota bacterium]
MKKISLWRKWTLKCALNRKEDRQTWNGAKMVKLPSDCLAIHKLLTRCSPQVVVECGSQYGGSAAFIASFAAEAKIESIISLDVVELERPKISIVNFITGDSSNREVFENVKNLVGARSCSVILDSNHHADHVEKELALFGDLVTPGQALIMEDTHVDVLNFKKFRETGGPLRALQQWLPQHPEFAPAENIEPYVTTNYFGYWIRTS